MPFPSFRFFLFTAIALAAYNLVAARYKSGVLLIFSYIFYSAAYPVHVTWLILVSATTYIGARLVARHPTRTMVAAVVTLTLLPLLGLKYGHLLGQLLNDIAVSAGWDLPEWVLPVGISFYTFRAVSYIVDVYRGAGRAQTGFGAIALYLAFFPCILAGPIERPRKFLPQLQTLTHTASRQAYVGAKYVLWGLFCKLVVADNIGRMVDGILATPAAESGLSLSAAFAMFSFEIYFDLVGYTAIAIGVARFFNLRLSRNFNRPYGATSLREFWRRWHITLSTWFRDYVYIPLGGNATRGIARVGQVMTVFVVSGLWHGAALSFMAWGGVHGTAYLLEEQLRRRTAGITAWLPRQTTVLCRPLRVAITFSVVTLAWVFFRLADFSEIRIVLERMLYINADVPYGSVSGVLKRPESYWFGLLLLTAIVLDSCRRTHVSLNVVPIASHHIVAELFFIDWLVVTLVLFGDWGPRDFLYFRF